MVACLHGVSSDDIACLLGEHNTAEFLEERHSHWEKPHISTVYEYDWVSYGDPSRNRKSGDL